MTFKQKLAGVIAIAFMITLIVESYTPDSTSEFSQLLRSFGYHQQEMSEVMTSNAVSGVEGGIVGEHTVNGSNWAIPNIIRHLVGVED